MRIAILSWHYGWNSYGMGRSLSETLTHIGHDMSLVKSGDNLNGFDQVWLVCSEGPVPKTTAPVIGFGWSDPNYFDETRMRACQVYFTQGLDVAALYPEEAIYLPVFADPRYFKPMPELRQHCCAFIGFCPHDWVKNRVKQTVALRAAGLTLKVYGQFWPTHPDNHTYVQWDALLVAMNAAELCVDLTNAETSLSSRILQSSLCGVPVLTCDRPDLRRMLEPESEVLLYQTQEEMIERALAYMKNPKPEIGQRARQRCLKDHLPIQRVEKILADVKERL